MKYLCPALLLILLLLLCLAVPSPGRPVPNAEAPSTCSCCDFAAAIKKRAVEQLCSHSAFVFYSVCRYRYSCASFI